MTISITNFQLYDIRFMISYLIKYVLGQEFQKNPSFKYTNGK